MDDRRDTLSAFQARLGELIARSGLSRTAFAQATGVDRSTLSQILLPSNRRLPRADTLVELARTQQVSLDWLLGLSNDGPVGAEILPETLSFETGAWSPNDERLIGWLAEAIGYKVRYVPSTLPDLLKTDAVIRYEFAALSTAQPEKKIETAAERLEWTRRPETDLECCSSWQSVESFARGEGVWRNLPATARREQLDQMIRLTDELYPTFRWFLYDGKERYAAPVTIFGPLRAALYLGQMYLVLGSADHVRTLTRHFDELIRAAIVHPHAVPVHLRALAAEI